MLLRIEEDDQIRLIEDVTHFCLERDESGWTMRFRATHLAKVTHVRISGTVRALNQFGIEVAVVECKTEEV